MNLGVALTKSGKKVLLIDSDPQANLTSYLGVTPGEGAFTNLNTLDQVYISKRPIDEGALQSWITPTSSGVDLIASDKSLSGVEYYLFSKPDRELILSRFLNQVQNRYDFVLIDTPPSLNLLTLNALCASHHVLIPVQPEFFSLEGIVKIKDSIEEIKARWNERLSIIGILPTQVATRRKLTQEVISTLKSELGELIFESLIHENAAIAESSGHAQSVMDYQRSSRGALDYNRACKELIQRASL